MIGAEARKTACRAPRYIAVKELFLRVNLVRRAINDALMAAPKGPVDPFVMVTPPIAMAAGITSASRESALVRQGCCQ
jgi:hypothetical protein